jgi:hypothetical protein
MFEKRTVLLDKVYRNVTGGNFDAILSALKTGELQSAARIIHLALDDTAGRIDNKKHSLTNEEWQECTFEMGRNGKGIHLVNSFDERAYTEITLKSSEVNRFLKFTTQAGSEQPKMGPKIYAYLAALYAHGEIQPTQDPINLFTDLEDHPDLWDERGPISQARGISAVTEFLAVVEHLDRQLADGLPVDDISFASTD